MHLFALVLLSQFWGPANCKTGNDCTVKTLATDGGIYLARDRSSDMSVICGAAGGGTAEVGRLRYSEYYNTPFYCKMSADGFSGYPMALNSNVLSAGISGPTLGEFEARTISTGVITTGNVWLGVGNIKEQGGYINTDGGISMIQSALCQCETNGIGAGNVLISFKEMGNSAAYNFCNVSIPCTEMGFAPVGGRLSRVCTTTLTTAGAGGIYIRFGMTADVSGCATPPAACVCSLKFFGN